MSYSNGIPVDHYAHIGAVIAHWTYLEGAAEEVIWAALGTPVDTGRVITSHLDAKYKLRLLRKLIKSKLPADRYLSATAIMDRMKELYDFRNIVAHGRWITVAPNNEPAVLSLREKLPDSAGSDHVMVTLMPDALMMNVVSNMNICYNFMIATRDVISTSPDTTPPQPPAP